MRDDSEHDCRLRTPDAVLLCGGKRQEGVLVALILGFSRTQIFAEYELSDKCLDILRHPFLKDVRKEGIDDADGN
jgi:hypothetical protein